MRRCRPGDCPDEKSPASRHSVGGGHPLRRPPETIIRHKLKPPPRFDEKTISRPSAVHARLDLSLIRREALKFPAPHGSEINIYGAETGGPDESQGLPVR